MSEPFPTRPHMLTATREELAAYVETLEEQARELMADLSFHEPGNPWRLDSLKDTSRLLYGDPFAFCGEPILAARRARGTTGGRFKLP